MTEPAFRPAPRGKAELLIRGDSWIGTVWPEGNNGFAWALLRENDWIDGQARTVEAAKAMLLDAVRAADENGIMLRSNNLHRTELAA